jgi:hypothetical protein
MNKLLIQYLVSAIFIIGGLAILFYAYTKKKSEIEKHKDFVNPPTRNYGKSFLVFIGSIFVVMGCCLLFIS